MNIVDLRSVDLNLLVVFDRLLRERRVSRTAEALGLTQPAVSNALARLRRLTGDELFLRTSAGMQPTPLAERMAEPVASALALIHGALEQRASFDPASARQGFRIGMTDIGEIYFLPALMRDLAGVAPGLSVSTLRNTAARLRDEMEAGEIDFGIGLLPQLKAGFFQRRLFTQRYVCLFRAGHPLDRKRRMTLAEFSHADQVVVVSEGTGHGLVDQRLARAGVTRNVRLTVPHFVAIGHILTHTEMIATVPERLAQSLAGPFGLSWSEHPADLPQIEINLYWHARRHRDPANEWLRARIAALFADDPLTKAPTSSNRPARAT